MADCKTLPRPAGAKTPQSEWDEIGRIVARNHTTQDDLWMDIDCRESYGEFYILPLMGYATDALREYAEAMGGVS